MAGRVPSAIHRRKRVQLDETTMGQLPAKQETVDAETGAGVEGVCLRRQAGAYGSLRKGPEGRAVGQRINKPTANLSELPNNVSVNHSKFLKNPVLLIYAWPSMAMPESIFSQIRFEMKIKCLLRSLISNSFRDVAYLLPLFLALSDL